MLPVSQRSRSRPATATHARVSRLKSSVTETLLLSRDEKVAVEEKLYLCVSAAKISLDHVSAQLGQVDYLTSSSEKEQHSSLAHAKRFRDPQLHHHQETTCLIGALRLGWSCCAGQVWLLKSGRIWGVPSHAASARYRNAPKPADRRPAPLTTPELHHTTARVPGTVAGPGLPLAPEALSRPLKDTVAPIAASPSYPHLTLPRCWRDGCDTIQLDTTSRSTRLRSSTSPLCASEYPITHLARPAHFNLTFVFAPLRRCRRCSRCRNSSSSALAGRWPSSPILASRDFRAGNQPPVAATDSWAVVELVLDLSWDDHSTGPGPQTLRDIVSPRYSSTRSRNRCVRMLWRQ